MNSARKMSSPLSIRTLPEELLPVLQVLRDAVKQVPKGKTVPVPVELLGPLLEGFVEHRSVPLGPEASQFFPSTEDLAERGQGFVTVEEAAKMLGVTNQAVQYAVREKKLPGRRVGKRLILIDVASVRAYRAKTPSAQKKSVDAEAVFEGSPASP